jgi:mono/diheme cytochrome c family protein
MRASLFLGTLATAAFPAAAQTSFSLEPLAPGSFAARAVEGAHIADQQCDFCHMVLQGGREDAAAPFAVIAARRSPDQVRAFLARPHGGRPPVDLSAAQIEDIIVYVRSLGVWRDIVP